MRRRRLSGALRPLSALGIFNRGKCWLLIAQIRVTRVCGVPGVQGRLVAMPQVAAALVEPGEKGVRVGATLYDIIAQLDPRPSLT